jgi:hypothetical protein
MQLRIDPAGVVRCVYAEAIDLSSLGPLTVRRASHVEPDEQGRWWADLSPVSGPRLGPFPVRSQAPGAERDWLEAHWPGRSDRPRRKHVPGPAQRAAACRALFLPIIPREDPMTAPLPRLEGAARDLFFFRSPSLWPAWPYLPVVRRRSDDDTDLGVLYDFAHTSGRTGYGRTVFLSNVVFLPDTEEGLFALPKEVFDTFEEVRAAGWAVDRALFSNTLEPPERRCAVIVLPRVLARTFRAVLRRCLSDPGSRPAPPVVLARCDGQAPTLQACGPEVAVRHTSPRDQPPAALAFRATVLAQCEGRTDAPVTLEEVAPGQGRASRAGDGLPGAAEFDTIDPGSVQQPPEVPSRMVALPPEFLAALGEAARTAGREAGRFAVGRVQLRGQTGQVVATDGRQMLLQGGFPFPWTDSVLVPPLPLLDLPGVSLPTPVSLARLDNSVVLRAGDWTFWLHVDADGRFPSVDDAVPRTTGATRLRLDPDDADFLTATLPRLPGRDDEYSPVTLDLSSPVAVWARSEKGGLAAEAVLARSTAVGRPVRVVTNRRYLHRAARLGFAEIHVVRPDVPLVCRDDRRVYVWMPLDPKAAVGPAPDMPRLLSAEAPPAPIDEPPPQRRRIAVMPAPDRNGRQPDDRLPPPGTPDRGGGIAELFAEAEALRNLLADAAARAARLVAALKQHRKQARAVEAAIASLRDMRLGN